MARAKSRRKSGRRRTSSAPVVALPPLPLADILGVIAMAVGIFLALSLLSYHPVDPSNNVAGLSGPAKNWMGVVGAWLAEGVAAPLGLGAVIVPVGLILIAMSLFQHRALRWSVGRFVAPVAILLFWCQILALYPGRIAFGGGTLEAGGWVGRVLADILIDLVNPAGAWIVVVSGLILSLQVFLGVEVGPLVTRVVAFVRTVVQSFSRWFGRGVAEGVSMFKEVALEGAGRIGERIRDGRDDAGDGWRAGRALPDSGGKPKARRLKNAKRTGVGDGGRDTSSGNAQLDLPLLERDPEGEVSIADVDDDDGDLADLNELPAASSAGGRSSRTLRKAVAGDGPKIVKSRYMQGEGTKARLSGEALRAALDPADFCLPSLDYLVLPERQEGVQSESELLESARTLEAKLRDYGVEGKVQEIHPGPVITMYEYAPAPGVKVSKITNLSNDLALSLRALSVRIVAPLPGKAAVGIEVPNKVRQTVFLRDIIEHEEFRNEKLLLPVAVGKDIEGKPYAGDLAKMPHLLVAGATGAGKSVAVNAMLISLLYARKPDEVRLILVDPKMIEFSVYNNIPHLLMPVVIDPKKAALALSWAVDEMTRRYELLTREGARNIASYNRLMEKRIEEMRSTAESAEVADEMLEDEERPEKLPYIVIVIDELADLMMVAGKEVQDSIVRLAQMARAAGIHLILATQRPSVDVITGLIKANFPARIAFKVSSKTDSRTILDANGAEYLLGNGDMLFLPPGTASIVRLHGAFVSDEEARKVVEHLREQGQPRFEESLLNFTSGEEDEGGAAEEDEDYDPKYEAAKRIVLESGAASISTIQRKLKIGYNRSARMVERMEREGLIGPPTQGGKPREIVADKLRASLG